MSQSPLAVRLVLAVTFVSAGWLHVDRVTANEAKSSKETSTDLTAVMPDEHRAVFKTYCYDCHGNGATEGQVDLEHLTFEVSRDIPTAEMWQKVLNAINSGEMPPRDSDPIADDAKADFLEALSTRMVTARQILTDAGGVITMRRLNRREYANTLEQLLGVRPDVSDLPDDQAAGGFDTTGAALFISGDQIETYLRIAADTLTLGFESLETRPSKVVRIEAEAEPLDRFREWMAKMQKELARAEAYYAQSEQPPSDFDFIDEGAVAKAKRQANQFLPQLEQHFARPETEHGSALLSTIRQGLYDVKTPRIESTAGGQYVLRVRAGLYPDVPSRYQYIEVSKQVTDAGGKEWVTWRRVTAPLDQPEIIEIPIDHPNGVSVRYFIHQRTHQGRGEKNLWSMNSKKNGIGTPPGVWVDWVELEGPLQNDAPSNLLSQLEVPDADSATELDDARRAIEWFAAKIFRGKQPTSDYVDRLLTMYSAERARDRSPQDALIRPFSIALSSPSFLYLVEDFESSREALTEFELASRLSYFLWSESPDDELLTLAREGTLSDPSVLREQTARLLADKRSERFVASFLHQSLDMQRLGLFEYVARYYPTFDNAVRAAARQEVYGMFRTALDEQLPLSTLLDADFLVINDVLADYYGLEGVEGHEFRKVMVPDGSPRGGLLATAAVLAMGSDGTKTSPVERGAWVLRHLLHSPPPPAPANVPQLSRLAGEKLSARKLQAAHQEQPQCANCHQKIDPIGYALENFDAAGAWRDDELQPLPGKFNAEVKYDRFPIQPAGELFTGESFEDFDGLRSVVTGHADRFARGIVEELIAYGLGRPYGFTDEDLANEILASGQNNQHTIDGLIHALVQSQAFRSK